MLDIRFLQSNRYKLIVISLWLLSFFLLTNSQYVINFTYIFLLLPTLLTVRFSELKNYFSNPITLLFVVFLITTIAAAFHSGRAISQAIYCFVILLFYLTIFRLPKIDAITEYRFAWTWFFVAIAYTLFNLILTWKSGTWHYGDRLITFSAFIDNPIYVADLLTVGLAMISFFAIKNNQFVRLAVAHVITLFFGLIILQSRSMLPAWLVVSVLTIAAAFLSNKHYLSKRHLIWLIIPVATLTYILSSETGANILARGDSYRFEIWQAYIQETIKCGIIFGCGMEDHIRYIASDGILMAHAHNIFIANFAKTGLAGTIPLLTLITITILYGLKKNKMAAWFFVASVTALLFDGSSLIKSPNERWIMIHLPLAYLIKLIVEEKMASKISVDLKDG